MHLPKRNRTAPTEDLEAGDIIVSAGSNFKSLKVRSWLDHLR